ncbi:MAG: hypothetical protein ACRER7_05290 [Gammaproteobacteria bacterium]
MGAAVSAAMCPKNIQRRRKVALFEFNTKTRIAYNYSNPNKQFQPIRFLKMKFWWVNQNQTFEQEIRGGYLWSPNRKSDGSINPFYESMREVAPGDLIFSFEGTLIRALGLATSYAREAPKPAEFGSAGPNWDRIGWCVDVDFRILQHQIKPIDEWHLVKP